MSRSTSTAPRSDTQPGEVRSLRRVLIADDDIDFADSLAQLLEFREYQTRVVHTEARALEEVAEFHPEVVLVDIRLAGNDGINLLRHLKGQHPEVLCIVVTAFATLETSIQALKEGAYDYLQKPIHPEVLLATLDRSYEKIKLEQDKTRAEHALLESEEKYRSLFETESNAILILDGSSGRILDANQSALQLYQYPREELLQRNAVDLFADADECQAWTERILSGETTRVPTCVHKRKDGSVFPQEMSAGIFQWNRKKVLFMVIQDITERRRNEKELNDYRNHLEDLVHQRTLEIQNVAEALEDSQRMLSALISNLPGIVYQRHPESEWVTEYMSEGCARLTGYPPEEFLNDNARSFFDLIHPDDRQRVIQTIKDGIESDRPFQCTYRILDAHKTTKWVEEQGCLVKNENNSPLCIQGLIRDITDKKKVVDALNKERREHEIIFNSSPAFIIYKDRNNVILRVNHAVEQALQMSSSEIVGKCYYEFFADSDTDRKGDASRVIEQGTPELGVIESFQLHNREKRWAQIDRVPFRDDQGEIQGMIVFAVDITSRVQAQNELKTAYSELETRIQERTQDLKLLNEQLERDIIERRRVEAELKSSQEQLRALLNRLESVREEERTSLAREVHDAFGQDLAFLQYELSVMEKLVPADQSAFLEKIRGMKRLVANTVKLVQKIATDLRPEMLDVLSLSKSIAWQTQEFSKRTGIQYKVNLEYEGTGLPKDKSTSIFRIFQESLTNIARHSQATLFVVDLKVSGNDMVLEIRDNGIGISNEPLNPLQSLGTLGMKERARTLGGSMRIVGTPDMGTVVSLKVPLHEQTS